MSSLVPKDVTLGSAPVEIEPVCDEKGDTDCIVDEALIVNIPAAAWHVGSVGMYQWAFENDAAGKPRPGTIYAQLFDLWSFCAGKYTQKTGDPPRVSGDLVFEQVMDKKRKEIVARRFFILYKKPNETFLINKLVRQKQLEKALHGYKPRRPGKRDDDDDDEDPEQDPQLKWSDAWIVLQSVIEAREIFAKEHPTPSTVVRNLVVHNDKLRLEKHDILSTKKQPFVSRRTIQEPVDKPGYFHKSMVSERYYQCVASYTASRLSWKRHQIDDINDVNDPFSPASIFNIARACEKAQALGAHPDQCNPDNYIARHDRYSTWRFPYPEYVQGLKAYRFVNVNEAVHAEFPDRHRPNRFDDEEGLLEIVHSDKPSVMSDMDFDTAKKKNELLEMEMKKGMSEEEKQMPWPQTPTYKKYQSDAFKNFQGVWHTDANHSIATKNIIREDKRFLDIEHDYSVPTNLVYDDLDTFGNMVHVWRNEFDVSLGLHSCHTQLIILLCAVGHLQYPRMMQFHVLFYGAAATSKSFLVNLLEELTSPDSITNIGDKSEKAQTYSGCDFSNTAQVSEETRASAFGVDASTSGKRGAGPSNGTTSDVAARLKQLMTSNVTKTQHLAIDANNERRMIYTITKTEHAYIFCSNDNLALQLQPAQRSRMLFLQAVEHKRIDGTLGSKMAGSDGSAEAQAERERVKRRWIRNQVLAAKISRLIQTKVLEPINMEVADCIWQCFGVISKAGKLGGADDTRRQERYRILVRMLVMWHAIHLVFDSELSPFVTGEVRLAERSILDVQPYLYATEAICVYALSCFADDMDDPIDSACLTCVKGALFPNVTKANERTDTIPTCYKDDKAFGYLKFKTRVVTISSEPGSVRTSKELEDMRKQQDYVLEEVAKIVVSHATKTAASRMLDHQMVLGVLKRKTETYLMREPEDEKALEEYKLRVASEQKFAFTQVWDCVNPIFVKDNILYVHKSLIFDIKTNKVLECIERVVSYPAAEQRYLMTAASIPALPAYGKVILAKKTDVVDSAFLDNANSGIIGEANKTREDTIGVLKKELEEKKQELERQNTLIERKLSLPKQRHRSRYSDAGESSDEPLNQIPIEVLTTERDRMEEDIARLDYELKEAAQEITNMRSSIVGPWLFNPGYRYHGVESTRVLSNPTLARSYSREMVAGPAPISIVKSNLDDLAVGCMFKRFGYTDEMLVREKRLPPLYMNSIANCIKITKSPDHLKNYAEESNPAQMHDNVIDTVSTLMNDVEDNNRDDGGRINVMQSRGITQLPHEIDPGAAAQIREELRLQPIEEEDEEMEGAPAAAPVPVAEEDEYLPDPVAEAPPPEEEAAMEEPGSMNFGTMLKELYTIRHRIRLEKEVDEHSDSGSSSSAPRKRASRPGSSASSALGNNSYGNVSEVSEVGEASDLEEPLPKRTMQRSTSLNSSLSGDGSGLFGFVRNPQ